DPGREQTGTGNTQTVEAPALKQASQRTRASDESTREMPRLRPQPAARAPAQPAAVRTEERKPPARPAAPKAQATPLKPSAPTKGPAPLDIKGKIIADAVRLLKWGKSWHELPETIGRIADRPPVAEIRRVLRAHKAEIE